MTRPAFVLGNGPTLPVDDLHLLDGQITIGVNRIILSGFVPSAVLWADDGVWDDVGCEIEDCGAVPLSLVGLSHRPGMFVLDPVGSEHDRGDARRCYISGSTGTAAARLALALGFDPVFLLGMSATYDGERTDFYGENRHHKEGTIDVLREETELLLREYQHHVWRTDDPADWVLADPLSKEEQRQIIREKLRAAGAREIP